MKTFDKKDIFTGINAEEAKDYIGKKGYFSNYYLNGLVEWHRGTLSEISSSYGSRITQIFFNNKRETFGLFLPEDKVKEVEEKKWRAFRDYQEFTTWTRKSVGDVIYIKNKTNKEENYISLITSYISWTNVITIGKDNFSLFQLFNCYEWLNEQGEWQPFGVEE